MKPEKQLMDSQGIPRYASLRNDEKPKYLWAVSTLSDEDDGNLVLVSYMVLAENYKEVEKWIKRRFESIAGKFLGMSAYRALNNNDRRLLDEGSDRIHQDINNLFYENFSSAAKRIKYP